MIDRLKKELIYIDEGLYHMELDNEIWTKHYRYLCKRRKIIKVTLKKLQKLEGKLK